MGNNMEENIRAYPELLADLAAHVGQRLAEKGISKDLAAELGLDVAEYLRGHWGGQSFYIPKGIAYDFSQRDLEIFRKCNGRNQVALAREYNVTVMRIYQIYKAVRAELVAKKQGALF